MTENTLCVSVVSFEHYKNPLGIDCACPRLSWRVETSLSAWQQKAYKARSLDCQGHIHEETEWIPSDQSVLVPWPFTPLQSREKLLVQVRVQGQDGSISPWSKAFSVEAGLLRKEDWKAQFITPPWNENSSQPNPCPFLRRKFVLSQGVLRARLYVTALGVYEVYLNGQIVGDQVFSPGWTDYHYRLPYQTFDVTRQLKRGENVLGAILGDGWYRGRLGFGGGRRNIYGNHLALLAQLEIVLEDGSTVMIITDESWRATQGPILSSDIYDGETYDARLELQGWSEPGYDDQNWPNVRILEMDFPLLFASPSPPVRRIELRSPSTIFTSPSGRVIVDFGQNLVGRVRFKVSGPRGTKITLRHAEILENGELCTRPLRTAKATDTYILRGDEEETWEPRFTFHGFRFVEVDGWPGTIKPEDFQAVVCHSDLERTGWFECSEPLVNRFHENVVWSMRGNFFSIPTDCPQRDERLGWTGDIQFFAPVAAFLYNVCGFLSSWLQDLALEQKELQGIVPLVVPNVLKTPPIAAAGWGDAAVIVPWVLYEYYGDKEILARQFESMKGWVDKIAEIAGQERLWKKGFQFGDWLDPAAPPEKPGDGRTDPYLIATAYFAYSTKILASAARILNNQEEALRYQKLFEEIRQAFLKEFVTPSGRLVSDTQTAYALALHFGLLDDENQRQRAIQRLKELVQVQGYRLHVGFVGAPFICQVLSEVGLVDIAYRLFLQRECPSWLYPVTMGATTIWERWDSLRPDGTVNPGEMTSFNHYALGAVANWLYRGVGGLIPLEPGYRRVLIRPLPGGGLKWARVKHLTPYGMLECNWSIKGDRIEIEVTIPPNTRALLVPPQSEEKPRELGSGRYFFSYPWRELENPLFSLQSPIGEIVAFPAAWEAVTRILSTFLPDWVLVKEFLEGQKERALGEVISECNFPKKEELLQELEKALTSFTKR